MKRIFLFIMSAVLVTDAFACNFHNFNMLTGLPAGRSIQPEELCDEFSRIDTFVDEETDHIQSVFKDIHQNPELGFMEHRTAAIVASELDALGFDVTTGIGVTGVAGVLQNGEGPTLLFRADMDANAVEEATGLDYASTTRVTNLEGVDTPVAHMCGHDAHTTWLISLARTMSALKEEWQGTLVLVAQPAEEPIEGAMAMVNDGLFSDYGIPEPDYALAMHTSPAPLGTVIATPGRMTTGSEHIDVTFYGDGGHGSAPQESEDPVLMAGQAIVQLQTIVSRMIDPEDTAVLTIGAVNAGVDNNVIPTSATLKLKLHFATEEAHETLVDGIKRICDSIAVANRIPAERMPSYRHKGYTPPVVNDEEFIADIHNVLGASGDAPLIMDDFRMAGSDDVAVFFTANENTKSAYLFLGTASHSLFDETMALPFTPHEPNYIVDLEGIPLGGKIAAKIAMSVFNQKGSVNFLSSPGI